MTNINISRVLSVIFNQGGVVFGGFVRDMLADETPADIDVLVSDIPKLLTSLVALGTVQIIGVSNYGNGIEVKLTVREGNENIWLDINPDNTTHKPDVDVNRLVMDRHSIKLMCPGDSLATVLDHIKHKTFVTESGCSQKRIDHMMRKGWEWMNWPNPPIETSRPLLQLETEIVKNVYQNCGKISAIKMFRVFTNMGLKDSKDAVEKLAIDYSWPVFSDTWSLTEFFDKYPEYRDFLPQHFRNQIR
jgi:hypothetical protein